MLLRLSGSRVKPGVVPTVAVWDKYSDLLGGSLSVDAVLRNVTALRSECYFSMLNPFPTYPAFVPSTIERRSPSRLPSRAYRHPRSGRVWRTTCCVAPQWTSPPVCPNPRRTRQDGPSQSPPEQPRSRDCRVKGRTFHVVSGYGLRPGLLVDKHCV